MIKDITINEAYKFTEEDYSIIDSIFDKIKSIIKHDSYLNLVNINLTFTYKSFTIKDISYIIKISEILSFINTVDNIVELLEPLEDPYTIDICSNIVELINKSGINSHKGKYKVVYNDDLENEINLNYHNIQHFIDIYNISNYDDSESCLLPFHYLLIDDHEYTAIKFQYLDSLFTYFTDTYEIRFEIIIDLLKYIKIDRIC